jgi:hypothetical protein
VLSCAEWCLKARVRDTAGTPFRRSKPGPGNDRGLVLALNSDVVTERRCRLRFQANAGAPERWVDPGASPGQRALRRSQSVSAATWNSLEIVTLIVQALIPVAIFSAGVVVARERRRYEEWRFVREKQFEARLERWSNVGPLLDDLYCFFALVGHFRSIEPPHAIALKGELDRLVHSEGHLLGPAFMQRYYTFMSACFKTYIGLGGVDAKLRASAARHRIERGDAAWRPEWDSLFVQEEDVVPMAQVRDAYTSVAATTEEL